MIGLHASSWILREVGHSAMMCVAVHRDALHRGQSGNLFSSLNLSCFAFFLLAMRAFCWFVQVFVSFAFGKGLPCGGLCWCMGGFNGWAGGFLDSLEKGVAGEE